MGIPASSIIYRAGHQLQDTDHIRWTVEELISWMNEAARAVITRRLDAGAYVDNLVLVAGTKQELPATAYRLIDVTRNMGTGATPGRVVKRCDRQMLDNCYPDWHTHAASNETRNFVYDDAANPNAFYVYPPANANRVLEAVLARFPVEIDDANDELDMDNGFEEAVLNFVLYRCWAKDSEYGDPGKAAAMMSAFQASLGEAAK